MPSLNLLHVADWLISLFVITPVLLGFWCGLFELFDYYLNSDATQTLRNAAITTGIGASFYLAYFVYPLVNRLTVNIQPLTRHTLVTVTMLLGAIPQMAYYKGMWMFAYWFLEPESWRVNLIACAGCFGFKVITGTTSGLIFPPFSCSVDLCPDVMSPKSFFGGEYPGLKAVPLIKYALGSAVSVFISTSFTVFCWSSGLCLVNKFEFKGDKTLYTMLGISTGVIVVIFLLEIPVSRLKRYLLEPSKSSAKRQVDTPTSVNNSLPQTSEKHSENSSASQNGVTTAVQTLEIDQNQEALDSKRKVSKLSWIRRRIAHSMFDSLVNLTIFASELFLYYFAWLLYDRIFLKERFYGAALSCAAGALLLSLLQITSLFGATSDCSDWFREVETTADRSETEVKNEGLYPNLYARYLKDYFKPTYVQINL